MHAVGIARWVFLSKVHLDFNRAWRAAVLYLVLSKYQSVLASTTRVVTKMPMDFALEGAADLAVLEWEDVAASRAIVKCICQNDNERKPWCETPPISNNNHHMHHTYNANRLLAPLHLHLFIFQSLPKCCPKAILCFHSSVKISNVSKLNS